MSATEVNTEQFPVELIKILKDFIGDVLTTFPEYKERFTDDELEFVMDNPNQSKMYKAVEYFKEVYPERFFDILLRILSYVCNM